jgi:hypothetical protein
MNAPQRGFGHRTRADQTQDPFDGLWRLKANERIYGPYTGHLMSQFKTEGRLAAHTLVARDGVSLVDAQWHTAASDSVLGALFRTAATASPTFGQRVEPGGSKFVVFIELKGGHSAELEAAIATLGPVHRVTPNLWLLSGSHTVGGLRNYIGQYLGPMDWMLVIDASQGRAGGFNMGPEMDAHIRRVWRNDQ